MSSVEQAAGTGRIRPQPPCSGSAAVFFSAAGRPILPLSFILGVDRGRAQRWRSQSADRGEDGAYHRAGGGRLGQLESDGAGVTDDTRPDLDQLQLQAGQRPVRHGLGQFDAAQECCQVVGQCVQLQPHLVVAELPA